MADGGNGGSGGEGGFSGNITLIALPNGLKLNGISASKGSTGFNGIGGSSDHASITGKTLIYTHNMVIITFSSDSYSVEKSNNIISLSCSAGKHGSIAFKSYKTKSQEKTEVEKNFVRIINKYKSYIEINLIDDVNETDLRNFSFFLEDKMVSKFKTQF